jgi:hypothetical protein
MGYLDARKADKQLGAPFSSNLYAICVDDAASASLLVR